MTWRTYGIVIALLLIYLAVPASGKNYYLHSPKLWSPQEKERYKQENPPAGEAKEAVDKQKEQHQKAPVKKQKIRSQKNQILVKDGVSYREVIVQQGDTVFGISSRYSREGASYAETLRFNGISAPDLIRIGDTIKVPLIKKKKADKKHQTKQPKTAAAAPLKLPTTTNAAVKTVPAATVIQRKDAFSNNTTARPQNHHPAVIQAPPASAITDTGKQPTFSNLTTSGPNLFAQAFKAYRSGDCESAIQMFNRFLAEHKSSLLAADANLFIAECYLKLSGK